MCVFYSFNSNAQCYDTDVFSPNGFNSSNSIVISYCDEIEYEFSITNVSCTTTSFDFRITMNESYNRFVNPSGFVANGTTPQLKTNFDNSNVVIGVGGTVTFTVVIEGIEYSNTGSANDISFYAKRTIDNDYAFIQTNQISSPYRPLVDQSVTTSILDIFDCENDAFKYVVVGNLNIDKDHCFNTLPGVPDHEQLVMIENSGITVIGNNPEPGISGYTLTIDGKTVRACDELWEGITVQNGATLIVNNSIIQGARNGIFLETGATLILNNSIIEDCIFGLRIDGDPEDVTITNNFFLNNTGAGIFVENTGDIVDLSSGSVATGNTIEGTGESIGIWLDDARANIRFYTINDHRTGILGQRGSTSVDIFDNEIDNITNRGIQFTNSNFRAQDNTITAPTAIWMFRCNDIGMLNNTITSTLTGIRASRSVEVDAFVNPIDLTTATNNRNQGISYRNTTGEITGNPITMNDSRFGISANGSAELEVLDNILTGGTQPAISNMGISLTRVNNALVKDNTVFDVTDGIRLFNSTGNEVDCNTVSADNIGLLVDNSSASQWIRANEFGGVTSLITRSVLGIQRHHGNRFIGFNGNPSFATAQGLDFGQVEASRFIADDDIDPSFIPDSFTPANLFDDEPDDLSETPNCPVLLQTPGGGILPPCDYIDSLIVEKSSDPQAYWVKMYRVYESYLSELNFTQWPTCLQNAWNNETEYGLTTFAQLYTDLDKSFHYKRTEVRQEYESLIAAIDSGSNQTVIQTHLSKFDSLRQLVRAEVASTLLTQYSQLIVMESTANLFPTWKPVYLMMLKETAGDTLTVNDSTLIVNTASLCARTHGDAVHWARDIAESISTVDFDKDDQWCASNQARQVSEKPELLEAITIAPNPANYYLEVRGLEEASVSTIQMLTLSGISVYDRQVTKNSVLIDTQNLVTGMYVLRMVHTDGSTEMRKIMITH